MADRYIDYWEVSEYGGHFVREAARLETVLNPFVNVTAVKNHVLAQMAAVEALRAMNVVKDSELRGDRSGLLEAVATMQQFVDRFFYYLRSLPAGTPMDVEAFFPGGVKGDVSKYKPADLLARSDDLASAFDSPKNSALPGAASWKSELDTGRAGLAAAIADAGDERTVGRDVTGQLAAARQSFLRAYNGMAKRMVYALLLYLGREEEYRSFFLDLQVNESGAPASPSDAPADEPGDEPGDEPVAGAADGSSNA